MESPRAKQVRENNERVHRENMSMVARDKHSGKSRPSKAHALERAKEMSKDYGSNFRNNRHMPHASL